ncbi:MAG: hypothetical protein ABIL37_01300 [candidate division WOR-3 bacterium]
MAMSIHKKIIIILVLFSIVFIIQPSLAIVIDEDGNGEWDGWTGGSIIGDDYGRTTWTYNLYLRKGFFVDQPINASIRLFVDITTPDNRWIYFQVKYGGTTLFTYSNLGQTNYLYFDDWVNVTTPIVKPAVFEIYVYLQQTSYSVYSYNVLLKKAIFSVESPFYLLSNVIIQDEVTRTLWNNFESPWAIKLNLIYSQGEEISTLSSNYFILCSQIPIQVLRIIAEYTSGSVIYPQHRQIVNPGNGTIYILLISQPQYITLVNFNVVDYTGKFRINTKLTVFLTDGTKLTEDIMGASLQTSVYLHYQRYYIIKLQSERGDVFNYGQLLCTSNSYTIVITNLKIENPTVINYTWLNNQTLSIVFSDTTSNYVEVILRNQSDIIVRESIEGNYINIVRNDLNISQIYYIDFYFKKNEKEYIYNLTYYPKKDITLSIIEFPFGNVLGFPLKELLSFFSILLFTTIFPSPYVRYGAVLGSSLLTIFAYFGWLNINLNFAIAILVATVLWAIMIRGRL